MKKYLLGIIAIVLAVGLNAFTVREKKHDSQFQTFTWHKYNAAGTDELSPVVSFDGTADEARTEFGCPDPGAVICGRAYDQGSPTAVYITKPAP